jgi:hypothetical protein
VLTSSVSLFVLTSNNNTLFTIQGSFSLLQSVGGQEEDEEETDESEDMNDGDEEASDDKEMKMRITDKHIP